jgi:hypothetical protein
MPRAVASRTGIVAIVAVGSKAVDLVRRDARAGAGGEDGFQSQLELRLRRLPMLVVLGFANANDGNLVTEGSIGHIHMPAAGFRAENSVEPFRKLS